jgi:hypothetical protein
MIDDYDTAWALIWVGKEAILVSLLFTAGRLKLVVID